MGRFRIDLSASSTVDFRDLHSHKEQKRKQRQNRKRKRQEGIRDVIFSRPPSKTDHDAMEDDDPMKEGQGREQSVDEVVRGVMAGDDGFAQPGGLLR